MKKYFNKALIYQWFNASKFAIIAGVLFWGLYSNSMISDMYALILNDISRLSSNEFRTLKLQQYFMLGVIFLVISILNFGNNKRNTEIFLYSGPYTKKQIKLNEFFCYMITLGIFALTYLYIAITFYIRNRERFIIINGYSNIISIEIIKIILFGILGIIIMLTIESMFSNSMVGIIFMIIIPISFMLSIFSKVGSYYNIWLERVLGKVVTAEEMNKYNSAGLFNGYISINEIRMRNLFIASVILLIIIVIFLFVLNYVQRKNSLESNVGIFGSTWSKKFILIYIPITFGIILSDILLGGYKQNLMPIDNLSKKLSIEAYLTSLSADIAISAVFGILIFIVLKKIIKILV